MSVASVVDGGWGTNGVKSVIISASFRRRSRSRVSDGQCTILAALVDDVLWGRWTIFGLPEAGEVIWERFILFFEEA
jgi:hypothetical protein